jgi:nicotinamidase-related amidase
MTEPEIPRQAEVALPSRESLLLVIDMQNDFVDPQGRLLVPEAQKTLGAIQHLLQKARDAGVRVAYTQDWHQEGDPEFAVWPPHCLAGSWGAQIVPALSPQPGEMVFPKPRYDGFYGTPLDHWLHLWGIRWVVLVGTVTNICVLHTAGSAALRGFQVVLAEDATSALTPFDQLLALRQISFLYKGIITQSHGLRFT